MSIDNRALLLAFRNRLADLEVCATSGVDLAATPTGYTRTSGSFITDGYEQGMELVPAGFTNAQNNERAIIEHVEALTIQTREPRITESSASGRTLSVGIPERLADENVVFSDEEVAEWPYMEEDYVRGARQMVSGPYDGGVMDERGIYALNWYFLPGYDSFAIHKCVDALLAHFAPGTTIGTGDNAVLIQGDPAPTATKPEPDDDGHVVVSIEIPWFALTTSTVTA